MTDFSRLGAHLVLDHFGRFDPKVPHFSRYYPPVISLQHYLRLGLCLDLTCAAIAVGPGGFTSSPSGTCFKS